MREGWNFPLLKEITEERRGSAALKDAQDYELWSVPSFSAGYPEIVKGSSILSAKRPVEAGDVLLCKINPRINRVWVVGDNEALPKVASTEWIVLRPRSTSLLSARWLQLYLSSSIFRDWIVGEISGATGSHTRAKPREVMRQKIPLPPLPEQKRIVAILDEAFAGIATAVANTEKNLANARELFESYLNGVFSRRTETCRLERFGEIAAFVRGPFGGSLKKNCFASDGYAVYEQQHAINDQFSAIRYFIDEKKFEEMARFELRPNDLIMSCSGTMGRVAIAPPNLIPGIINQALLKLTPSARVDPRYLKFWMNSIKFAKEIASYSKGAAIKNVASVKVLKEIRVPLPDLCEQRSLVKDLTECLERTNDLASLWQQKLASLAELKQSLLQKAFSGELTNEPQDEIETALA